MTYMTVTANDLRYDTTTTFPRDSFQNTPCVQGCAVQQSTCIREPASLRNSGGSGGSGGLRRVGVRLVLQKIVSRASPKYWAEVQGGGGC